jgi:hypothetical protein
MTLVENEAPQLNETRDPEVAAGPREARGSSLPLIFTIIALLIWFAFQTVQLVSERTSLGAVKSNLEAPMQESQKVQSQLQSLITKTAELASQGSPGAKAAVDELEKRGIPIKSAVPPSK